MVGTHIVVKTMHTIYVPSKARQNSNVERNGGYLHTLGPRNIPMCSLSLFGLKVRELEFVFLCNFV